MDSLTYIHETSETSKTKKVDIVLLFKLRSTSKTYVLNNIFTHPLNRFISKIKHSYLIMYYCKVEKIYQFMINEIFILRLPVFDS